MARITGTTPVPLFHSGKDGYGYAVAEEGKETYHWTMNWDVRSLNRAVPSAVPMYLAKIPDVSAFSATPPAALFEWTTTTNDPIIVIAGGAGATHRRISAGGSFSGLSFLSAATGSEPYLTSGVLYRFDQTTSNADAPMAWFCNGANNTVLFRRSQAGTIDTGSPTVHTAKADLLAVIGSDLWRAKGYKVSLCGLDLNPGLETSWGTGIAVGLPSYPVNEIVNLGGSPIVAKGDGAFKYNPAPTVAEFQNIIPSISPHPDNGKGAFADGRGRIYYPTFDGDLLVLGFGTQSQQRPTRLSGPDRDTPAGRVTTGTVDQEFVYVALGEGAKRTNKNQGLVVITDNGGVKTEITSTVIDGGSSSVSLATLGTADYLYVGADSPFLGVWFSFSPNSTRTLDQVSGSFVQVLDVQYSTSTSGFTSMGVGANDSTLAWFRDGLITMQLATNADIATTWTLGDDPRGGAEPQKYWARFRPTVGDMAGVALREISIVPYRPPLDPDLFPISNYALAGCFPKILAGRWDGDEIIWQDSWTLNAPRIDKMIASRVGYRGQTSERSLVAIAGMGGVYFMPIGADGDPVRSPWARLGLYLAQTGEDILALEAQSEHLIAFSGNSFGLPDNIKQVDTLVIDFPYLQSDDAVWVYLWWDEDAERVEKYGPFSESSIVIQNVKGEGRTLYSALAFSDGSRDAVSPQLRSVTIPAGQWSYETEHFMLHRQDLQSVPLR